MLDVHVLHALKEESWDEEYVILSEDVSVVSQEVDRLRLENARLAAQLQEAKQRQEGDTEFQIFVF